jgi:hypothetical protein
MRKFLRITSFIVVLAYFLPLIIPIKIIAESSWHKTICFLFMIPYAIYESIQLIKDDKINNTHTFRKRLIMMVVAAVILILSSIYMNRAYHP